MLQTSANNADYIVPAGEDVQEKRGPSVTWADVVIEIFYWAWIDRVKNRSMTKPTSRGHSKESAKHLV